MPKTIQHSLVQLFAGLLLGSRNEFVQHLAGRSCHWFFPTCQASSGGWTRAHVGPHKDDFEQVGGGHIIILHECISQREEYVV